MNVNLDEAIAVSEESCMDYKKYVLPMKWKSVNVSENIDSIIY